MRLLAVLSVLLAVLGETTPAAAAPEGQLTWAVHAHGPRVAESGLGPINGWAFSAPYEDLKLKGK